jgi:hypothetical protein
VSWLLYRLGLIELTLTIILLEVYFQQQARIIISTLTLILTSIVDNMQKVFSQARTTSAAVSAIVIFPGKRVTNSSQTSLLLLGVGLGLELLNPHKFSSVC